MELAGRRCISFCLLPMSVFTITHKHVLFLFSVHMYCITCIILSFLYVQVRCFFMIRSIVLFLMCDLSLMPVRAPFCCTCSWTYVCMYGSWHGESIYTSYNRIFFKIKFSKYRTLYHIHPISVIYLSFVFFFVEWLSVDDYMKINFQTLMSIWILRAKMIWRWTLNLVCSPL